MIMYIHVECLINVFQMTRRIYKGIPDSLRGEIWARLLDINKVKAEQSGVYRVSITTFKKQLFKDLKY